MKESFILLESTRNLLLKQIEPLNLKEINKLPKGFVNNIAWNVAHIIATQQILCYKLSGLNYTLPSSFIELYKKGTSPLSDINEQEWQQIKQWFKEGNQKLESDYENGIFQNFDVYPTSYGYTLHTIEQAIEFNNVHAALHLGYIMAIKKAL